MSALKEIPRLLKLPTMSFLLFGPRQSGKTTLLKHLLGGEYGYVSKALPGCMLHAGHIRLPLGTAVTALPFTEP